MNKKKTQKEVFLESEADAWLERNRAAVEFAADRSSPVLSAVDSVIESGLAPDVLKVLEIGCGEGSRLKKIADKWGATVHGLDPSAKAVVLSAEKGINAVQGTADKLPFDDSAFDLVIFGFCLYLCDREDLFVIASETDRILKPDSWLIIQDFYSDHPVRKAYHHLEGLFSYKMDYRKLFDWHPSYTCFSHSVLHHESSLFTDSKDDWVATSLLRKQSST
jgi:SAM-dependent methyltransferase